MRYLLGLLLPSLGLAQSGFPKLSTSPSSVESVLEVQLPLAWAEVVWAHAKCAAMQSKECINCCKSVVPPSTPVSVSDSTKLEKDFTQRDSSTLVYVVSGKNVSSRKVAPAPSGATPSPFSDVLELIQVRNPTGECLRKCKTPTTAQ